MKRFSGDYEAKLSELQRQVAYLKYLNNELVTRNKFEPTTRMTRHENRSNLSGGNSFLGFLLTSLCFGPGPDRSLVMTEMGHDQIFVMPEIIFWVMTVT